MSEQRKSGLAETVSSGVYGMFAALALILGVEAVLFMGRLIVLSWGW